VGAGALILLDTHVLVWLAVEPARISPRARSAIRRARSGGEISVASITLWEIAVLLARGRLQAPGTIESGVRLFIEKTSVVVREITPEIAALAAQFPDDYSGDPADRLIGATARAEGIPLITRDELMRASPLIRTVW
jgi:PIN domain nuclease of toxin-antitoxin system